MRLNVAIDGPAGAGKSSVAKEIAKRKGIIYVDTGAMYRAMALFMLRNGLGAQDDELIDGKCEEADITIKYDNGEQQVWLNGENVSPYIRTEEVGNMASVVSARAKVRVKLVELQQKLATENDCVMDGRDIGTVVIPKAPVKIYLTASSAVRAKRRFDELTAKGVECDIDQIQKDIEDRDYRDMHREHSPLMQAEDAVVVDSSDMTLEEVITTIMGMC